MLRWAVHEAGKPHARTPAPGHGYYATVKDRTNTKRAALSQARKIVRQACHILTGLGDDALTAAGHPALHSDQAPRHPGPGSDGSHTHRMGTTAASSRRTAVRRRRPVRAHPWPGGRPDQTERPHPRQAGDTQSIILSPGQRPRPAHPGKAGCSQNPPPRVSPAGHPARQEGPRPEPLNRHPHPLPAPCRRE